MFTAPSLRAILLAGLAVAQIGGASGGSAEEAIERAREALRSAEREFGPGHPATAMMMRELALAFERGGYHQQAEYYAGQSLASLEARLGKDDVNLVPALNVLAEAYAAEGRNSEALRLEIRAIQIGPAAGKHFGTALHNAAAVLFREGKLAESEEFFARALAARVATLPAGHPYIEATREQLKTVQKAARLAAKSDALRR
jgi:tetratricopeptide (TPR) repeat protein